MALVVLLRGVNVGGHRTFRPTKLAEQLHHLKMLNIGAAGTFVVRQPVTRSRLRSELTQRLPFDTDVVIFEGRELTELLAEDYFANKPARPDIVRFVSVLARQSRRTPSIPMSCPAGGNWMVKLLARRGRFVVGVYRRQTKAISYLGVLDRLFGVPATTRNWKTVAAIVRALEDDVR